MKIQVHYFFIGILILLNSCAVHKQQGAVKINGQIKPYLQPHRKKVKLVKTKRVNDIQKETAKNSSQQTPGLSLKDSFDLLNKIEAFFSSAQFFEVIVEYESLAEKVERSIIPSYYTLLYGMALMKKRDFEQGAAVLTSIDLEHLDLPEKADLYLELGRVFAKSDASKSKKYFSLYLSHTQDRGAVRAVVREKVANLDEDAKGLARQFQEQYQNASDLALSGQNMKKAVAICKQIIENATEPEFGVWRERASKLIENINTRVDTKFDQQISEVRNLYLERYAFEEALEGLSRIELEFESEKYKDRIKEVFDDIGKVQKFVDSTENKSEFSKSTEPAIQDQVSKLYEEALLLKKNKQYKPAIRKLESIEGSELSEKVKYQKKQIIDIHVKMVRKEASEIYLKGTMVNDPVKKKDLILKSYHLLRSLVIDYPDASMIQTIQENMSFLSGELAKLGYFVANKKE